MNPLRVLIVDDEPLARGILEGFVGMAPQLQLAGSCANALEALVSLERMPVDLMLLDIDMPQLNGIEFLRSLQHAPKVIFTTAYHQYAIDGYEHDAVDYLLKPIRFERFLKAVNKLRPAVPAPAPADSGAAPAGLLFVKSEGKLIRIDLGEVLFVEGLKDYVAFHTLSGKLVVHSTMKALEDRLQAAPAFLRIHKSYIVNLQFVREVDGNCMRVGAETLTVGAIYREPVSAALARFRLL